MQTDNPTAIESTPPFEALHRGDGIRVSFGRFGSQLAIVHDWTGFGNLRVWKFSAKRKRWLGPIRLGKGEFISRAREFEFQAIPGLPAAYMDNVKHRKLRR